MGVAFSNSAAMDGRFLILAIRDERKNFLARPRKVGWLTFATRTAAKDYR
jgi:hypothetical protein